MKFHHIPVLFNETIEMLNLKPGQIIVDATLGGGGHAGGILERIAPDGTLIGIDRDPNALAAARAHLKEYGDSLITVHGNFNDLGTILGKLNIPYINGLVMDLVFHPTSWMRKAVVFLIRMMHPGYENGSDPFSVP